MELYGSLSLPIRGTTHYWGADPSLAWRRSGLCLICGGSIVVKSRKSRYCRRHGRLRREVQPQIERLIQRARQRRENA